MLARKRVAVFIVNYNMPEKADALAEYLAKSTKYPYDLYLVDNGSDLVPPAKNTTVFISKNVQTCNGWLVGLDAADKRRTKYFAYWFLITSARFVDDIDCLSLMVKKLEDDKNAVGIHPSLTPSSTTSWGHLKNRGMGEVRRTWMIDNIASIYRADWFDKIGRFDPELRYAWGIDLETCYLARKEGRSLWIDDRVEMEKITDIGYKIKRMGMSAETRRSLAYENMDEVLSKRYGSGWGLVMQERVLDEWK